MFAKTKANHLLYKFKLIDLQLTILKVLTSKISWMFKDLNNQERKRDNFETVLGKTT